MSKTLTEIAQQLSTPKTVRKTVPEKTKDVDETKPVPKVQLIYAFNGTGKTRLSREFKQLIVPKANGEEDDEEADESELSRNKILYYNAFTEDLFYWDNDLAEDAEHKLKIQPNSYTDWLLTLLKDLGQDGNIVKYFQRYTNDKLTPHFSEDFAEVSFSLERGDNERSGSIKISKGEESNFIWSVFYALLDQVIAILNVAEPESRETRQFDQLEYVFIDDPVSSLDDNHLIEVAVNLAGIIKSSKSDLKFIITTHNPLFYNVLFNEFNNKTCYMLERFEDGSFTLTEKHGDSNKSFSYHLHLLETIEQAIADQKVERYHFTLLRNLYEKAASFLGYPKWSELLPDDKQLYLSRIINFTSHSTLSNEAIAEPTPAEKATVKLLLDHLKNNYGFWQQEAV
ncbi:anticodon nuclease [Acidovorax sp. Root275]|uniref:AAA family ATPase n=1 Tax=Acidovorax sp. Root275 TaxID=1736508 RepID=UPI00070D2437|nr:AAA family ATPase [Acidovorax sp. Root275]KRD55633.1 anticodon nuclease [Acidovorax sp. Root275]